MLLVCPFCKWCANTGAERDRARAKTTQVFVETMRRIEDLREIELVGRDYERQGNICVIKRRGDESSKDLVIALCGLGEICTEIFSKTIKRRRQGDLLKIVCRRDLLRCQSTANH
jgi:hypothetical protein